MKISKQSEKQLLFEWGLFKRLVQQQDRQQNSRCTDAPKKWKFY